MSKLRVLSLFSGIGGFELGLERTGGFAPVGFCEVDPFCNELLRARWPDVPNFGDITKLSGQRALEECGGIDVICGGFPCQDISLAGRGGGLAGTRSGLWAEYARLVGEILPRYVLVENVSALRVRGLGTVLADLAAVGFSCLWDCIPASALGAHHRRDRVWIVAWRNDYGDCEIVRRHASVRELRECLPQKGGCSKGRERSVLFDGMRLTEKVWADAPDCRYREDVLRRRSDSEGDISENRGGLAAHPTSVGASEHPNTVRSATGAGSKINGEIPPDCERETGRDSSPPELCRDGRQTGKSCSCVEKKAFRIAQAIRSHIGATIHGGTDNFRSEGWLSNYTASLSDDEIAVAYELTPLAPIISSSSSLPTPEASNTKAVALRSQGRSPRDFLTPLPTPSVCGNYNRKGASKTSGDGLATWVSRWPTPRASESENRQTKPTPSQIAGKHGMNLAIAVHLYPTPAASDYKGAVSLASAQKRADESKRGVRLAEHIARETGENVGGALNPDWVEWLMGFPVHWTDPKSECSREALTWASEPDIPRVAAGVPDRANRLKGLGNAVVPVIPEILGRAILASRKRAAVYVEARA